MYSTNTNNQQDGRQQAPDIKPAPKGANYILHIEDVVTRNGRPGLAIYMETICKADRKTPASRVASLLMEVIESNSDTIGEVVVDTLNSNQEDQQ